RLLRNADWLAGSNHRRGRLKKQQRLLGHFIAQLRGVVAIVAADADELAGNNRSEQPGRVQANRRKPRGGELRPRVFFKRRQQALNPENSIAVDDLTILRAGFAFESAVLHSFLLLLLWDILPTE